MARGESPKDRPFSIGLALGAIVGIAALCTLFGVAASFRASSAPTYAYPGPGVGLAEPFRGATASFATLTSRDSARATQMGGAALSRDPLLARATAESALRQRGYVEGATAESAVLPLPAELTPADLDGACGVVLAIGDGGTSLTRGGVVGATSFRAADPSALTIASCGTAPIRFEGTGNVVVRTWLLPGVVPAALTSTGAPADAVLAHAEAEIALRRLGYTPSAELVEITPTATTAGGFVTLRAPVTPSSGCIPFVVYVEGAGRPQIPPGRFDYLEDRGLVGAVSCAVTGSGWEPSFVDDSTVGARVWLRAYTSGAPETSPIPTIGSATHVDASIATWPAAIASQ
ncbi:MAG: hypothetical protein U0234_04610 [Sandaracinus sp.]